MPIQQKPMRCIGFFFGAGYGSRTRLFSLGNRWLRVMLYILECQKPCVFKALKQFFTFKIYKIL